MRYGFSCRQHLWGETSVKFSKPFRTTRVKRQRFSHRNHCVLGFYPEANSCAGGDKGDTLMRETPKSGFGLFRNNGSNLKNKSPSEKTGCMQPMSSSSILQTLPKPTRGLMTANHFSLMRIMERMRPALLLCSIVTKDWRKKWKHMPQKLNDWVSRPRVLPNLLCLLLKPSRVEWYTTVIHQMVKMRRIKKMTKKEKSLARLYHKNKQRLGSDTEVLYYPGTEEKH